jgi:putative tryptophan/tyrosine transport system substrate-binding protein
VIGMKRRKFMTLLSGTVSWPLTAQAQLLPKLPTIGILGPTNAAVAEQWTAALVKRLRELGWIEGRTVAIEYRWAEGRIERAAEIADEFVRLKVDVIVTSGTLNVIAAKQATLATPIVFVAAGDPIGSGLVASLARPGGNATGLSSQSTDLAAKRIELLREAIPNLRRMAVMINPAYVGAKFEMAEIQAAAGTLGVELVTREIRRTEDIAPAFEIIMGRVRRSMS